ncbi:response regulator [Halostella sp. JP-L12]|uniref:response regulator n=1 Tax=Halostella TaxID=1843185 RepID=UPI000EF76148|nr:MULTISPECIES: response regulator [Halostella]NHN47314.1 response regulator [Halostella sp. JP-L12]
MPNHNRHRRTDEPIDVLLVEDNPGDVRLTREAFAATDAETTIRAVDDGDDAVERLARRSASESASLPDLALVDLNLPGRDGCGVLEAIRDDPDLRRLPVVMLTSSEDREDIAQCYDANANAYLSKPTDPAEFVALAEAVEDFWFDRVHFPPVSR